MSTDCVITEIDSSIDTDSSTLENPDSCNSESNNTTNNITNDKTNNTTNISINSNTELENLIHILEDGISKKEAGLKYIKYPGLLVVALKELNSLIGMHRLKESVALQTVQLIERMKNGEKSTAMLNTLLSAPPGCGKSKVGVILAKIWFSLGFLNSGITTTTTTTTKKKIDMPLSVPSGDGTMALILLLIAWGGTYAIQMVSFAYNKIGLFWLGFILGFILLIIVVFYWGNTNTEWVKKYLYEEKITEEELKNVSDRDIISVVSRDNFVGEFLGHTAIKTKRLLEANTGKVLFIDEAYSLLNDPRDAYGYEALNTLNLYLSENPEKIVVIFAGYKERMDIIFAAQPGLSRRIMWKFTCDPYSGEELAEIFLIQAKNEGWNIEEKEKEKIRKLIIRNEAAFPAYGGDTERLVYLSSLEASRSNLSNITSSFLSTLSHETIKKTKTLTYKNVEQGLISLKEN